MYDEIHFIYQYCIANAGKGKHVKVFRETLVDCREKTLVDFKRCFSLMNLEKDVHYTLTGDGQGGKPLITIAGNIIEFKGYPEEGVQEGDSNVVFINEILETKSIETFENIIQRCTDIVICDANPNITDHFIFHLQDEFNTFYTNTTYLDNDHLPEGLQADYESKCPFDLRDSHIEIVDALPYCDPGQNEMFFNGFRKRVWDKPECKENEVYNPEIHRRISEANKKTAKRVWWYVMGEGLPIAKEGAIFSDADWVQEFPQTGLDEVVLSMDFGYTCFDGNTKITTLNGEKSIKDICVGEYVLTENGMNLRRIIVVALLKMKMFVIECLLKLLLLTKHLKKQKVLDAIGMV